jgi:hypothetical protein
MIFLNRIANALYVAKEKEIEIHARVEKFKHDNLSVMDM